MQYQMNSNENKKEIEKKSGDTQFAHRKVRATKIKSSIKQSLEQDIRNWATSSAMQAMILSVWSKAKHRHHSSHALH